MIFCCFFFACKTIKKNSKNYLQNAVRPADSGDSVGNRNPLKLDGMHDKFWYDDW